MSRRTLLRVLSITLVLAMIIPVTGGVFADVPAPQRLSASPNFLPPISTTQPFSIAPQALINDGSFENGPPPSSAWSESNSTPDCATWIGNWTDAWGLAPIHGSYDYWAGGYCCGDPCAVHSGYVQQTVTIPGGQNEILIAFYVSLRPDADDGGDTAWVKANGSTVWSLAMTQANDTYPDFKPIVVDVPEGSVTLQFGADSSGEQTGNVRFDAIISCPLIMALEANDKGGSDLQVLRRFRDEIMVNSPVGQQYVDLYYKHALEVTTMLLKDAKLRTRFTDLVQQYLPAVRAMVKEAGGQQMVLTAKDVSQLQALMDAMASEASPELRTAINDLRADTSSYAGKTPAQIWQATVQ